jgi:hypothetical protein
MKYVARIRMRAAFPNAIFTNLTDSASDVERMIHFGMVFSPYVRGTLRALFPESIFKEKPFRVISIPERAR